MAKRRALISDDRKRKLIKNYPLIVKKYQIRTDGKPERPFYTSSPSSSLPAPRTVCMTKSSSLPSTQFPRSAPAHPSTFNTSSRFPYSPRSRQVIIPIAARGRNVSPSKTYTSHRRAAASMDMRKVKRDDMSGSRKDCGGSWRTWWRCVWRAGSL